MYGSNCGYGNCSPSDHLESSTFSIYRGIHASAGGVDIPKDLCENRGVFFLDPMKHSNHSSIASVDVIFAPVVEEF